MALGIVHGDQTVARGELLAFLTAARIASRHDPPKKAVFITGAQYVYNIVALVCSGLWRYILHKLPKCDLVAELAEIWDKDLFMVQKGQSHRKFESATDFDDLWMIVGNFCADLAATEAFRVVPDDIRKLANDIASHVTDEEKRLYEVLQYLAFFNKHRYREKQSMYHITPSSKMPCIGFRGVVPI